MTDTLQAPTSLRVREGKGSRLRNGSLLSWVGLALGVLILQVFAKSESFPAPWQGVISGPIDQFDEWAHNNRRTNPLFTAFFHPISAAVNWALTSLEGLLQWLPWFVLPIFVFLFIARSRRWKLALVAAGVLLYPGLVGLWDVTLETLSLMFISVLISVVIGVPLGVWAALRPRVETLFRPILDAMQTVPAPVYFIPMLLFFGVGRMPSAIATVIYALPAAVRLTTLGIKGVPKPAVEASQMFGSTKRQTLFKVQLPMAMPTIMTGVNQTIMLALGIVVLATLLGAGGLGQAVMDGLRQRRTGRSLAAGLAIVAIAMVLDRVFRSVAESDRTKKVSRRSVWLAVGGVIGLVVLGRVMGWLDFPTVWAVKVFDPVDSVVIWARDNLSFITRPINDFVVAGLLIPVRDFLMLVVAWPVLIFVTAWMCWKFKGIRLAIFAAATLMVVGLIGMWDLSVATLTQVVACVLISVAIAIPVGIWAGRLPRVEAALGPILDGLQTIPSLVYIIPVVILFSVGQVPGIIASVLYAIVPGIRITALGIREVAPESIEASQTFGATPRQTMFGVRIPLAAPTIMAGVNQVIMMVLAMLIISGLVGGGALGFETVRAVTRNETGYGFEVGLAIVVMAIILDRLTQAWATRLQPPTAN